MLEYLWNYSRNIKEIFLNIPQVANNQEEKIKKVFKKHRIGSTKAIKDLFDGGSGSFYHAIKKEPLDLEFIDKVKKVYGFDIEEELLKIEDVTMDHINDLWKEIRTLRKTLEETHNILMEIKKGR
jgi:hypothetical protein